MRHFLMWLAAVVAVIVLIPTAPVYAYLDPGTGSFLLQILVAGLLGILFALRVFRDRIMILFRRLLGRPSSSVDDTSSESSSDS